MDRQDYIDKMLSVLSDENKFSKESSQKDQTEQTESKLTQMLKNMKNESIISSELLEQILPSGSVILRLYGLPKVHKEIVPLRPILDMTNSSYHATAKWLTEILLPIRNNLCKHSVSDSFEFVDSISDANVSGKKTISTDVTSLFTNVPLIETICFICEFIEDNNVDVCVLIHYLKKLFLRCTLNVQFKFNNTIYRQRGGVAMGSPLGLLLADCFLASLENSILRPTIDSFYLYQRYMDDTFVICDDDTDIELITKDFNSCHQVHVGIRH
ncbi:unnamed protein product [Trichobilharzia regenti]|nr:unnamed protein product [Trichobilharzia regenti]